MINAIWTCDDYSEADNKTKYFEIGEEQVMLESNIYRVSHIKHLKGTQVNGDVSPLYFFFVLSTGEYH